MNALAVLVPALPLVLAALAILPVGSAARRLAPIVAALPGLWFALAGPEGTTVHLTQVLLGMELGLDPVRRPVLLMTAFLWFLAGVYAAGYMAGSHNLARFTVFFLLAMAGNLGLIVALDVPTFYFFFALMTLSSFVLVVHDGRPVSLLAGTVYIILSVLGETMVLLGLLRASAAAGSLEMAAIPAAIASDPAAIALLAVGFAVKAGQFPLHVWLPLAHPAAPTPASAVLSGAMIKAGILGMALCLPLGHEVIDGSMLAPAIGTIGLFTAFYGAGVGLFQSNPKTVLAYSSLSQMGLIVAAFGMALCAPALAPAALIAISIYAVHHGCAKAALFLSVGVVERSAGPIRQLTMAGAALCTASIAGAPFMAGGYAKDLLKDVATREPASWLAGLVYEALPYSAFATSLLLIRFLMRLAAKAPGTGAGALLWLPFLTAAVGAQALPFLVGGPDAKGMSLGAVWSSAAPLLAAGGTMLVLGLIGRITGREGALPSLPEGDLIALTRRLPAFGQQQQPVKEPPAVAPPTRGPIPGPILGALLTQLEAIARDRRGTALVLAALAIALAFAVLYG